MKFTKPPAQTSGAPYGGAAPPEFKGGVGATIKSTTPSVFQDMSDLETPQELKEVFRWCKYLSQWSAVHKSYVGAASTLPITNVIAKSQLDDSDPIRRIKEEKGQREDRANALITKHWRLKNVMKEVLKSKATYSNAVAILSFPYEKFLKCMDCDHRVAAESAKWTAPAGRFEWECPECSSTKTPDVYDRDINDPERVRIVVLDMEQIDTVKHVFTDKIDCYYTVPNRIVEDITAGERSTILNTPQAILDSVRDSLHEPAGSTEATPRVKLREGHHFIITDPTLSDVETGGLSFPAFAASFKDYWQYRMMLKAQEVILGGHATPRRFLYPEASGTSGNLFEMVHVASLMDLLKEEVTKHERDPNYISMIPFPVGELTLGGQAKMLSFSTEMRVVIESMCASIQSPLEFLFGGMSFSASSITVKKMHVQFEADREAALELLQWAVDAIHKQTGSPSMTLELGSFRLADDLQHLQFMMSLHQMNLISRQRMQEEIGVDPLTESDRILKDQDYMAKLRKAEIHTQAQAEETMGQRPAVAEAKGHAASLAAMVDETSKLRKSIMADPAKLEIVKTMPEVYQQIFGTANLDEPIPETTNTSVGVPDPQVVAPEAAQNAVGSGNLDPEVLKNILAEFNNLPMEDWEAAKKDISDIFGPAALRELVPKLEELRAMKSFSPEDRPGRSQSGYQIVS